MRTMLIALLIALAGCEARETAAERTAAAYKVCHEAGLEGREGTNQLGALTIYCAPKQEAAGHE